MALPPEVQVFESGLLAAQPLGGYVESVIRTNVENAIREAAQDSDRSRIKREVEEHPFLQSTPQSSSADELLDKIGEYLIRSANICAHVASNLSKGPHIDEIVREVHQSALDQTKLSDLSRISCRDVELTKIRKLRDISVQYARDIKSVYEPDPQPQPPSAGFQPPFGPVGTILGAPGSAHDGDEDEPRALKARRVQAESPADDMSDSGASSSDTFDTINMEALRQRGKGTYSCPKGKRCTKGGVDKEGNVIVFDRNSSFVQHCNKHRKPWRCNLPGCPNPIKKRRFARRDGLERHQKTVKHAG